MKIAIIGAGAGGLCAARYCLQENFSVDVLEQTGCAGGTWNYTDDVGYDENGVAVHSSMYKGLRTNLPKEVMAFEDFPYGQQDESYLHQPEVLEYIRSYMKKFQIEPHIKFYKQVLWVEPQDGQWLVEFEDVKTKQKESGHYDAVIVCNGHYKDAFIPDIPGADNFQAKHSHDYRSPEGYKDKKVLVIGAGPSGVDIAQQILPVATKVYISYKSVSFLPVPETLHKKPLVKRFYGTKAVFEDGTTEEIDDVLFCTGYIYSYPFLSSKCGVKVDDNYVHPLYKQVISIENPTLAFLGVPFTVCPFPLFGIQVRFFLSTLNGHFKLPSKEDMLKQLDEETKNSGLPKRKLHHLGVNQGLYFEDLASTAKIKGVPPVIHKLYMRVRMMGRNLDSRFRIIDDENWEQVR